MQQAPDTRGEHLLRHLRRLAQERQVKVPEFVVPREADVHTGRMRQHYLDWGNEGATPVVFMHAGRLNAHSWDLVCLALRPKFRCLAVDLPGHGDSESAPGHDYSMASCAEDLHGFVDGLMLDKFFLVGLSQGGMQALAFAGRYANHLRGLVIMDIGPDTRPEGIERQRSSMAVFEPMASFEDFVRIAQAERASRDEEKLRFSIAQNVRQRPDGKWVWKFDTEHRSREDGADVHAAQRSLAEFVPRIDCPALVLRGARSDIFLREQAAAFARSFPNGRWAEIPGAGHLLHLHNPRAVIAALREFFEETAIKAAGSS